MKSCLCAVVMAGAVAIAGCGGPSAEPDASGAPASDQTTLYRAANLSKVLRSVKAKIAKDAKVTTVKVEPRDVKVITTSKIVTVDAQGRSLSIPAQAGQADQSFDFSVISAQAAARTAKAVEAKAGVKQSDVSYLLATADPVTGKPHWTVHLSSGSDYQASIAGRGLKPLAR